MATADRASDDVDADVLIVGAGVAGLSCGIFTARAGLETVVADGGPSILERNAHLENYPGFPGGVDARRFLAACREQAIGAGCEIVDGRVTDCTRDDAGVRVDTEVGALHDAADGGEFLAERLVAASWSDASYLASLDVETSDRGSKTVVDVGSEGRASADDVYAAGRIAGRPHQTVVAAGHGATVGLAVIRDADVAFYHDWVAPAGYFTDRGRDVPPGCEEIDDAERREREAASRERFRTLLDEPQEPPRTHPSLEDDGAD